MCGYILFEHMKLSKICLAGRHIQEKDKFIGWHDMQVGMYYWKTCVSGGHHVFHENMCYGRTCVVGGHVLQVGMSCRSVQKHPFKLL